MTFVYTPGIPLGTDEPSQSAPLFAANYSYLSSFLNVDHVYTGTYNGITTEGMHNKVHFDVNQAAPALDGAVSVLYSDLINGQSHLAYRNAAGSFGLVAVNPSSLQTGYSSIPGGIIIQWGFFNAFPTPTGIITYPIAFPTAAFNVQITLVSIIGGTNHRQTISVINGTVNQNNFTYSFSQFDADFVGFFWMAIGN